MDEKYKNFIKGFLSGSVQTLSGHPLDTMKVLSQNKNFNIKSLLNQNFFTKSFFGKYYRGVSYPLILNSFIVGIQFDTFYSYGSICSGITSGLILTPFDYYKTNKQIYNKKIFIPKSINQFKYVDLPKGFNITICREIIALSIYFKSYDYLKNNNYNILFSGGVAGSLSWLLSYPIDTIKTRYQLGQSYKEAFNNKNLWRGLPITLLRAFIINGLGFYCAELI